MIIVSIFVFFVIPLTYALFKGIINSSAAMNAASYSVTLNQTQEDSYISVVAGDNTSSASYTVNITSTSEVDIIYSIIVDNVPSGVTVSLDNGSFTTPTNNKVIFANVSTINYSDVNKTKSHKQTTTGSLENPQRKTLLEVLGFSSIFIFISRLSSLR